MMGSNGGNVGVGPGSNELGGMMAGNAGASHPPATEYTLQGVMRFLQTEWHRHERDRNAWEIERQEMKARIANLEGSVRRGDATQKALQKYVTILQNKVKEQAAQLKGGAAAGEEDKHKADRAALLQEKLRPSGAVKIEKSPLEVEGMENERTDEDTKRDELKSLLDQCQSEFIYLMVTPANPLPPRESPPLPGLDDFRDGGAFGVPVTQQQPMEQQVPFGQGQRVQQSNTRELNIRPVPTAAGHPPQPLQPVHPANYALKNPDLQPAPMVRTSNTEPTSSLYGNAASDWPAQVSMSGRPLDDATNEASQQLRNMTRPEGLTEVADKKGTMTEADGWDFGEGAFPETSQPPAQQQQQPQLPQQTTRPDTDVFPAAESIPKSPNRGALSHRRKSSSSMSRRKSSDYELSLNAMAAQKAETNSNFKLRFGLRGHLNVVRTIIFSGGGSPGEPEICTADDDGMIKRFHIPADRPAGHLVNSSSDMDVVADFTHRGHHGAVLALTSWSPAPNFSTGGRAQGDGWIFSGGKDGTIRVWERGRVDPKATLDGHTDSVWAVCVLPTTLGAVFGPSSPYGTPERILLVSGGADGTVRLWAVSAPPQLTSPQPPASSRRGPGGRVRGNSMSSGSQFPSSPQPTMASNSPFHYTLVHKISRSNSDACPTCITPLSPNGESFVVSYSDAAIIVYDTRTGEEIGSMASLETYDGTLDTSVNAVVATTAGLDQAHQGGLEDETGGGPTGGGRSMAGSGVEGVIISGHEDRFIRFFDANSGQCTYNMLAHPASISSLSLSPDGRELVSAGHDASLRFWSLEKRSCTQEVTVHRIMRGEGVCSVVWSQDGRWVVSGGGDGVVKVFAR